jgi:hypothetical protein
MGKSMTPRVWFKSISLENARSFGTKQTINFTDKEGNAAQWNVILGDIWDGENNQPFAGMVRANFPELQKIDDL